jgi:phenylacetyl-CoA:acceptor oxidoreductase subunit 2
MKSAPYGAQPWPQTFWDARAAANFICGGLGSGLVVAATVSGAHGAALAAMLLPGLAIVACGLLAVFAEIGRPLRAANVVLNPGSSWMTREALVAPLLFAAGIAAAFVAPALAPVAAALALAFVYCQGRMLQAARGIPAWRAAPVPWLLVVTGLAEGAGLALAFAAVLGAPSGGIALLAAVAIVTRAILWRVYRGALPATLAAEARGALAQAERVLLRLGTIAPLMLLVIAAIAQPSPWAPWLGFVAGLAAAAAGAWLKAVLVLRAGHVQGFALANLPVRGQRG